MGWVETNCTFDSVMFMQLTTGWVVTNFSQSQTVPLNKKICEGSQSLEFLLFKDTKTSAVGTVPWNVCSSAINPSLETMYGVVTNLYEVPFGKSLRTWNRPKFWTIFYIYNFIFLSCEIVCFFFSLNGVSSFLLRRCTRRSECRRAEEKNGWLWSPRQQCVKIVSFYPPNLSCKKTQKVPLLLPLFLPSLLLTHPFLLFHAPPSPTPSLSLLLNPLSCTSHQRTCWLSNKQLPLRVGEPGLQVFLLCIDPKPKATHRLIITQLLDCACSSLTMESLFFCAPLLQEKKKNACQPAPFRHNQLFTFLLSCDSLKQSVAGSLAALWLPTSRRV